jgi:chaperonin cofactor prefoldin
MADIERKRNRLTLLELEKLPDSTTTYKAVGKMFIAIPYSSIVSEVKSAAEGMLIRNLSFQSFSLLICFVSDAEKHIADSSTKKAALEKSVTEVESNLKEILSSARG